MNTPRPALLTVSEAATRFEVAPRTIRKWIEQGRLSYIKTPGGQYRIPASETELAGGPPLNGYY